MSKIYLASSWRNQRQPEVLAALRQAGHEVYDFRNPAPGDTGFGWREIESAWMDWTPSEFMQALVHPIADHGFSLDMNALRWCDTCILLLPCGRSAHLELGWATGAGKKTVVLLDEPLSPDGARRPIGERGWEPELMYKMCDLITESIDVVVNRLAKWHNQSVDDGIRIIVGSMSQHKIDAVLAACKRLGVAAMVQGTGAPSQVPEQPVGFNQIFRGAMNRAFGAQIKHDGAGLYIGIESGIVDTGSVYMDMAGVVVRKGSRFVAFSTSSGIVFPDEYVVPAMQRKVTVGKIMAERTGCESTDLSSSLTGGKVSRAEMLTHGVMVALAQALFGKDDASP